MIGMSMALRNQRLDRIRDAIDGANGTGKVEIYSDPRPSTGSAPAGAVMLTTLNFSRPCAPKASDGRSIFHPINPNGLVKATGTAAWARLKDASGVFLLDLSVSQIGGQGEMQFGRLDFKAGQQVSLKNFVLTEDNA